MVWNLPKSDGNRGARMPFLTLAGWGLVATSSFVVAFMALQFAQFDDPTLVASAGDPADITGSINAASKSSIGIIQRGADASKPSKTQELSTDVDLLRKELIALRRTVSSIRESRNDLAVRLSLVEKKYEGFTATLAQARQAQTQVPAQVQAQARAPESAIPSDPLPLTTSTVAEKPEIPPLPPIPVAAPPVRTAAAAETKKSARPAKTTKTPRRVDAPLTTASIPKKTEPETEAKSVDKTSFGVDLGGYSSLSTLGKGWMELKKSDQKTLVANLAPRASLSDKNGRLEVRLVAGPFDNAAHAVTLCAQLQAKGRPCQPTLFVGQPVVTQ